MLAIKGERAPDEVREQLSAAGLAHLQVTAQEPFHLSISGRL